MVDARTPAVIARLRAAGCVDADAEAAAYLNAAPDPATLDAWLARREDGEPAAWILGTITFCGRPLRVDPGVYVPRRQTQDLAGRAAALLAESGRALDLCTGAGAIATHLRRAVPSARVVGVDLDAHSVRCARSNGVAAVRGDLASPIGGDGTWDLVTAVAPYVPTDALRLLPADVQRHEPRAALDGGPDGLALVYRVVQAANRLLRTGGWLLTEVGGTQDERLRPVLAAHGFDAVVPWSDEDGDLRGIAARRGQRYSVRSR
jgi:release factor glutamine methyltransferase